MEEVAERRDGASPCTVQRGEDALVALVPSPVALRCRFVQRLQQLADSLHGRPIFSLGRGRVDDSHGGENIFSPWRGKLKNCEGRRAVLPSLPFPVVCCAFRFVLLAPWGAGMGDREDVALSYVYVDSGCVAASWLCVL